MVFLQNPSHLLGFSFSFPLEHSVSSHIFFLLHLLSPRTVPPLPNGRHIGKPLSHYVGVGSLGGMWKVNKTGSQKAWASALIQSLANDLILGKEILLTRLLFPVGNTRAMEPMLSKVYNSTNHLLSNYTMDDVSKDIVPPRTHNLLGTKIILKLDFA